jgi:hypothetical protein
VRDLATVRGALEALQTVQQQLDFSLLQTRGWWARTTGKARSAGAEFAAQVEQITEATRALGTLASLLQKSQPGESAVTERTLVDMEVEYRALDQLVEQGAKWLQDMRTQLQQRHAAAAADPAAQQQVREDAARCEILVTRLKALRAISAMARATLNQTREVLALFLAIDVGNTRLKWALYDQPAPGAALLAQGAEFLENIDKLADGPWAGLPPPQRMLGCVVAGDAVKRRVEEQMEMWDVAPQWVVASEAEAGLTNGYDHPTPGRDRWVAMIGARHRMLARGPPGRWWW